MEKDFELFGSNLLRFTMTLSRVSGLMCVVVNDRFSNVFHIFVIAER